MPNTKVQNSAISNGSCNSIDLSHQTRHGICLDLFHKLAGLSAKDNSFISKNQFLNSQKYLIFFKN